MKEGEEEKKVLLP